MNKKKQVPISVLKAIEPFMSKSGENFIAIDNENDMIRFKDRDPTSDFYFHIKQFKMQNGFTVLLDSKPTSENSVANNSRWVKGTEIEQNFANWIGLLKKYDQIQSPFDDPILTSFRDSYYAEFEIIEEEKNKPLNPSKILLLDEYFEKIETGIEKYRSESNSEVIDSIKDEIEEIRENLSSKSKQWIANKIAWTWAKITKLGPKIMRDLLSESNKQIVREGVKQLIEIGKNIIS